MIDKMGPSHTEVIRKMTVSIGTSSTAGGDSGGERRVHRITVTVPVLWVISYAHLHMRDCNLRSRALRLVRQRWAISPSAPC